MHFQLIELIDERIYPKWEMGKTAPVVNTGDPGHSR